MSVDHAREEVRFGEAEDRGDVGDADGAAGEGDDLIEQRERIAHAPFAAAGHDLQRRALGLDPFRLADLLELRDEVVERDLAQDELLHAREDRLRNLVHLRRREHEDHVRRRLLDQLEQRVPRGGGEHVRLVDDEDAVAVARGLELRDVAQLADVVDAGVRRGVDLAHVHVDAFGDLTAHRAGVVRLGGRTLDAVQRLGQDARGGGLADAADAGEEIGVMDAVVLDRVVQRPDRGLLTDDVVERSGDGTCAREPGRTCGVSIEGSVGRFRSVTADD